jgi:uncharacterized membrane-anchored protein
MQKILKRLIACLQKAATSWYVLGLAGWAIVAWNYPLQEILPRYAG